MILNFSIKCLSFVREMSVKMTDLLLMSRDAVARAELAAGGLAMHVIG